MSAECVVLRNATALLLPRCVYLFTPPASSGLQNVAVKFEQRPRERQH